LAMRSDGVSLIADRIQHVHEQSQYYFPTRCAECFSFSLQMYSRISP